MSIFEPQASGYVPHRRSPSDDGARRSDTIRALLSDVDEFLSYIAIVKTPEVDAVRHTLERSLRDARRELLRAAKSVSGPAVSRSVSAPWRPIIGVVAVAALGGLLAGWLRRHHVR